jgi:hypothetical protein
MNCDEALPLIYDLIDEELTESDARTLKEHIAHCPACRVELESIKAAESLYRKEIALTPPAKLDERIVAAVWKENLSANKSTLRSRLARAALIGLAAAIPAAAVYWVSLIPASGIVVERFYNLSNSLSPQLEAILSAFAKINIMLLFNQLIDSVTGTFRNIEPDVPVTDGFYMLALLSLIALQIAGSYRLLGDDEKREKQR